MTRPERSAVRATGLRLRAASDAGTASLVPPLHHGLAASRASAILARQSFPVALNLAMVSGSRRRVTAAFGLSMRGRPGRRLMLSARPGNASLNVLAFAISALVIGGLSETSSQSCLV